MTNNETSATVDVPPSSREQTVLIRERGTVSAATAMLSEAGRADRDRLLAASAVALVVALPAVVDKLALGPIELSKFPIGALRWGTLLGLLYFTLSFVSQAGLDLLKWRANLNLALLEMKGRLDVHKVALDERAHDASEHNARFQRRIADFRARIEPLNAEFFQLMSSSRDPARVAVLEAEMAELHDRLAHDNATDAGPALTPSEDFAAVLGVDRRVGRLRALMLTNVAVNITMPVFIAGVAAGPIIWALYHRS